MNEINYHVWKVNISDQKAELLGFTKREGYYEKLIESQMTTDYVRIR